MSDKKNVEDKIKYDLDYFLSTLTEEEKAMIPEQYQVEIREKIRKNQSSRLINDIKRNLRVQKTKKTDFDKIYELLNKHDFPISGLSKTLERRISTYKHGEQCENLLQEMEKWILKKQKKAFIKSSKKEVVESTKAERKQFRSELNEKKDIELQKKNEELQKVRQEREDIKKQIKLERKKQREIFKEKIKVFEDQIVKE